MKISPTGAACGSAEIKKPTQDIKSQEIDIGGENAKTKIDTYENKIKTTKQAIGFNGATAVVSFRNLQNDAVVQISVTAENIERFKERFGGEIVEDGNGRYALAGKAERYMGAFWEYYRELQPDADNNGYIEYAEYKKSKSLLVGYDEKNGAPVTSEISSGLTDKDLEDRGIGADLKISVDEDFNNLLKYDKNIDGVIGKNELAEGMATDMSNLAASGKDVAFLRWLLWLAEGMQDEEKKKKNQQNAQMETTELRRIISDGINELPDIKNSGKLAELLQNLKSSLTNN